MTACRENYPHLKLHYCDSAEQVADEADALVLVTEWKHFAGLDLAALAKRMTRTILVDGRNLFDPERARQAGFDYTGVGRPQRAGVAAKETDLHLAIH
jgi:UDPglucose 6-dehydrogenase